MAPEAATMSPDTVPQNRGKGQGRYDCKQDDTEGEGEQRCRHVVVGNVNNAVGHRPHAEEQGEDIEEPDGGNGHNGRFSCRGLARDGVIADQNVWVVPRYRRIMPASG